MRAIILISLLLSMIVAAPAAHSIIQSGAHLKVELAKYDPFPAEAGKFVNIWFKIENDGGSSAEDITFILHEDYPLSLPGNDSTKNYGRITPDSDILLEYKLFVDTEAPKDDVEIVLEYNLGGGGTFEKNFTITIGKEKQRAELKALFVEIDPKAVPSRDTTLTIDVVNRDKGTAYFTIVRAESPAATINRNELFIGTLEPDDFDSADFELSIKNVEPGTYPVEITMLYKDEDSNEFQTTDTLQISVVPFSEAVEAEQVPAWMYVLYVIALIIVIRIALPIIHWIIKPVKKLFRRKK